MKYRLLFLGVALIAGTSLIGAQQPLRLQIAGGRVTLHAQNVAVRTILTEWARLGGAKIVNGDRVVGPPVTLDLENVPERQALDIILRGVSGYMLAARGPGAAGASLYDRIMILPTSAAPRTPPPTTAGPTGPNSPGLVRPFPPRVPDDQDDGADATNGAAANDGVPVPRPVAIERPTPNAPGVNGVPPPFGTPDDTPAKTPTGVVTTPGNPFGIPPGSSVLPGVIAPPVPASPPPARNGPANANAR